MDVKLTMSSGNHLILDRMVQKKFSTVEKSLKVTNAMATVSYDLQNVRIGASVFQ